MSVDNSNADALSRFSVLKTPTIVGEVDHLKVVIKILVECINYGRKGEASDCFKINPTEFSLQ